MFGVHVRGAIKLVAESYIVLSIGFSSIRIAVNTQIRQGIFIGTIVV